MPDTTDTELIRQFVRERSEAAFAELVRRHVNLVYSVARRCTSNATDAEDVTQIVFHIFARKAGELKPGTLLSGWFYTTTQIASARFMRGKARREAREQESMAMQETLGTDDHNSRVLWQQLVPHLDAAMSRLNDRDRTLLILRFFENKSGSQTAAALGIQEAAAHKRTARALEKLREIFFQHGITLSVAALATVLSTHAVQAAPMHCVAPIAAAASGATLTAASSGILHETLKAMAWAKAKWTVALGSLAVTTGVVGIAINSLGGASPPTNPALAREILRAAFARASSELPTHLRIVAEVQRVNRPWTETQIREEVLREEKETQLREQGAGGMKEADWAKMPKADREAHERIVAELRAIQTEVLHIAHGTRTYRMQEWLAGDRWRMDQFELTPKSDRLQRLDRPLPPGVEFETTMVRVADTNLSANIPDFVNHRLQMATINGSQWNREALWEATTLEPSIGFLLTMIAGDWMTAVAKHQINAPQNGGLDSFAGMTWDTNKLEELVSGKSGRWKIETSEKTTNGRTFAVLHLKGRSFSLARGIDLAFFVDPADARKLHRIELHGMPLIKTPYISIRDEFDTNGFPHLWIIETPNELVARRTVKINEVAWGVAFNTNTTFEIVVPTPYQILRPTPR